MHYDWIYEFNFPGRKIKDISASEFENSVQGETDLWVDTMFSTSRFGKHFTDYEENLGKTNKVYVINKIGKGTPSGQITLNQTATLSGTPKSLPRDGLAKNVYGFEYYFPILIRIELEPLSGKAEIRHFTKDGKSLDGVDGFKNYEEKLELKKPYTPKHTPEPANYKYIGYKKSTVSLPSGGERQEGEPPAISEYEGDFPVYYINYYYEKIGQQCKPGEPSCGGEAPPPDVNCTEQTGQILSGDISDPAASAVIRADRRGSEQFNVLDGIPTSESLYGNVSAKNYLYRDKFVQKVGRCTYTVPVTKTYNLEWTETEDGPPDAKGKPTKVEVPKTDSKTVTKTYTVERSYAYWKIENLEVYRIREAELQNYAFANSSIQILPSGYLPPDYEFSTGGGYTPAPSKEVTLPSEKAGKNVPDQDFKSDAEKAIAKIKVRSDYLKFNGSLIMDNRETEENAPVPGQIPAPAAIGQDILYSTGHVIPSTKVNKKDQPSSGTLHYSLMNASIGGGSDRSYPIQGINPVTVHTPVVMYASVSDDQAHNQKTTPTAGRSAVILDRPFTVTLPTAGQHVQYTGYGYRDYAKYTRTKQVQFPFDVYTDSRDKYIPKNTWIDVPVGQTQVSFFLPVWVDEGYYDVRFRSIVENAPFDYSEQLLANTALVHHAAGDSIPVEVIGRLYDFHVTDIADYLWEPVFRLQKGSSMPTGHSYWVGQSGIDGALRGNDSLFTLPIHPGSHPDTGYRNVAVKTGYHFKFDFKTKGNMFDLGDQIRITPSFFFVTKDGRTRVPVDLYYHDPIRKFIKIGSPEDTVKRYVLLGDRLRNVPAEELTDTALYRYDHDYTFGQIANLSRNHFVSRYLYRAANTRIPIGSFSLLTLPGEARTLIGPKTGVPASVQPDRANAAIQKWYGEYSLPADVYAVRAGTRLSEYGRTHRGLTDRSSVFLRNGYIIVNFNLESLPMGDPARPRLQYIHAPLMNQWRLEGFKSLVTDSFKHTFQLQDGDVVFYDADLSSRDDFQASVTH
ncbi:DUF5704 domain-containing protein [Paenibacillus sp. CAA11]|uniref:DUF5704 domain-containing protein n=1 Tax=Paenibacillus sp. CAA11 TaxID=1532905 RepID=UPI001F16C67C|nr:DUF5704 domain-containing protein [Paenibacillus sp. CAA11]